MITPSYSFTFAWGFNYKIGEKRGLQTLLPINYSGHHQPSDKPFSPPLPALFSYFESVVH